MVILLIFYLVCPPEQGRFKAYQDCGPCPPGFYNDGSVTKETQFCIMCPNGFTSFETGAEDASSCTGRYIVRNFLSTRNISGQNRSTYNCIYLIILYLISYLGA